jgi:hypothetical protein
MLQIAINQQYLFPILFEFVVFLLFFGILVHFIGLWLQRKNKITQMLIFFLLFYILAITFTLFTQMNKRLLIVSVISPRVIDSLDEGYKLLVFIANYFFYRFYLEIFSDSSRPSKMNKIFPILTVIGIIIGLFSLFVEIEQYFVVDIVLIIHSFSLYFPTAKQTLLSYREIPKDDFNRYRFLFLCFMAIVFILIWIANIANVAWDLITSRLYGPFWAISWYLIAIDGILAYLGFGMPKWFKILVKKHSNS